MARLRSPLATVWVLIPAPFSYFFKLCTDDPTLEKRLRGVYTCNPGWSIYNSGTPKSPVITVGLSFFTPLIIGLKC